MKKFLLSLLFLLVSVPMMIFAQSTEIPVEPTLNTLSSILLSAKGVVSFLIAIAIGLMTSGIKTPISFSVLTYAVNILQGILAFIQKILPDDLAIDGSSHINSVKVVAKVSVEQDK
jgi:hypothetical protein